MQVAEGVHWLRKARGSNVYLLVDKDSLALIDTGMPGNARRITNYILSLGREVRELRYVVLTHGHPDHTGSVRELVRLADVEVVAHSGDVNHDGEGRSWVHYISQPLHLQWDVPFFQKVPAHTLVVDGDELPMLDGLRVVHCPGHTPGSIALYLEKRGLLFTGDTLLSNGRRFSRSLPFPGYQGKLYHESLRRLAGLEFGVAFPGHGKPIVTGAVSQLRWMLKEYGDVPGRWSVKWWLSRVLQGRAC